MKHTRHLIIIIVILIIYIIVYCHISNSKSETIFARCILIIVNDMNMRKSNIYIPTHLPFVHIHTSQSFTHSHTLSTTNYHLFVSPLLILIEWLIALYIIHWRIALFIVSLFINSRVISSEYDVAFLCNYRISVARHTFVLTLVYVNFI